MCFGCLCLEFGEERYSKKMVCTFCRRSTALPTASPTHINGLSHTILSNSQPVGCYSSQSPSGLLKGVVNPASDCHLCVLGQRDPNCCF